MRCCVCVVWCMHAFSRERLLAPPSLIMRCESNCLHSHRRADGENDLFATPGEAYKKKIGSAFSSLEWPGRDKLRVFLFLLPLGPASAAAAATLFCTWSAPPAAADIGSIPICIVADIAMAIDCAVQAGRQALLHTRSLERSERRIIIKASCWGKMMSPARDAQFSYLVANGEWNILLKVWDENKRAKKQYCLWWREREREDRMREGGARPTYIWSVFYTLRSKMENVARVCHVSQRNCAHGNFCTLDFCRRIKLHCSKFAFCYSAL